MTDVIDTPEQWPGVEPAQAFVLPSYQWMVARVEAADSRIQTLVAFAATVTFAVPGWTRTTVGQFQSPWYIASVVLAVLVVGLGIVARVSGTLKLPNPQRLFDKWCRLTLYEFHKSALFYAGEHFESNLKLVNRKAIAAMVMTALFVSEVICLLVWTVRA